MSFGFAVCVVVVAMRSRQQRIGWPTRQRGPWRAKQLQATALSAFCLRAERWGHAHVVPLSVMLKKLHRSCCKGALLLQRRLHSRAWFCPFIYWYD